MYNYELKLDIDFKPTDTNKLVDQIIERVIFLEDVFCVQFEKFEVFETNKGLHIYVKIGSKNKLKNTDIVVLQLVLGSDYKREIYNWMRVRNGGNVKYWNKLFKKKTVKGVVVSEEKKTELAVELESKLNSAKNLYRQLL